MTAKEVVETLKQAIDLIESQQAKINKLEKVRQKQAECLVELRITLESFGKVHRDQIFARLEREKYRPRMVRTNL